MDSKKLFNSNRPEDYAFNSILQLIFQARETGEINKPYVKNALKTIGTFSYNSAAVSKAVREVMIRLEKEKAKQLLSGNAFSSPNPKTLSGEVYVGNEVGSNLPVYLSLRNFNENIGIWGRAGSSKTNTCQILCLNLYRLGIPIRIYDYKEEYRDLLPFFENGIALNPKFDKCNPLEPKGPPKAWLQFLVDTLQQDFNIKPETKFMLLNYMDELYKRYGIYENSNTYPNIRNLKDFLLEEADKSTTKAAKKRKIYTCIEVIDSLLTSIGDMLDCSSGYSETSLAGFKFISYEMPGLSYNIQSWLSKIRLKDLHQVCFSNTVRNKLKTVCFFEEAKMLFSETLHQSSTSVDYIKQLVTQGRSPGLSEVFTDQNKNELADFVLNNLSCQICFSLSSLKERRLTGYSLDCSNERQIQQFSYLKIPYAVMLKTGYPPFLIKIPKSPVTKHISYDELIEIVKPRLTNSTITPSQGPQRMKLNLNYQPNYEARPEPKQKTLKDYLQDIKHFLEQVKNNLQLNISKLYASLKLSGRKGDKIKEQLLENGLIEEQVIRTGERKRPSKTLRLTAKGERIFSWLKQKVKGA